MAGHLIVSVFAIALAFALKQKWQSTKRTVWIFFGSFLLSQVAGLTLVLTSANSSLSVTITIVIGLCLSAALFAKPLLHWKKRLKSAREHRDF